MNKRRHFLPVCLATITLSSGCSLMAPRYTASIDNVQKIKDADTQPVKVGTFDSTPGNGNANPISIRGSSLASPYDSSYAKYIAEALRQDLELAGKLAPDAKIEISGALQKNDVNPIAKHSLTLIAIPEITTTSSSSGVLTWMATDFTVQLSCKFTDVAGREVATVSSTGIGHAEFSDLKSDFSVAGERAASDALEKFQAAVLKSEALRR